MCVFAESIPSAHGYLHQLNKLLHMYFTDYGICFFVIILYIYEI